MAVIATLAVKLQAQIAEFQAEFKEAAKSTEQFQKDFEKTAVKASAYGNLIAVGVVAGVDALKNLGASVLDNASKISDLSAKTGLSMRTIQEFDHVAAQTGTTVEAFANAAFNLGVKLAGGGNSVVNALDQLGLSFEEVQRLSPDEKFKVVVDALGKIEDASKRNRIEQELFGRTTKEIAAAVAEGYSKLAADARVASDDQIGSIDRLGDAWTRFQKHALSVATSVAGGTVLHFEEVEAAIDKMDARFGGLRLMMPGNVSAMGDYVEALVSVREEANNIDLSKQIEQMQKLALLRLTPLGPTGHSTLQPGTADYRAVEADLDASLKRQNRAWDEAARIAKAAMDKAKAAADAYRESVRDLRDEFSGANLEADVKKLEAAFRLLTDEQRRSPAVQDRVGEAAERLRQDGARLSPELQLLAQRTEAFSEWLNKVPGQTAVWATGFDTLRDALKTPLVQLAGMDVALRQIAEGPSLSEFPLRSVADDVKAVADRIDALNDKPIAITWKTDNTLTQLSGLLTGIGDALGGTAGDIAKFAGGVVGAFDSMTKAAAEFGEGTISAASFAIGSASSILGIFQMIQAFEAAEAAENRAIRALIAARGGRDAFNAAAILAGGGAVRRLEMANTIRDFEQVEALIRAQEEAMERYHLTWRDFNATVAQTQVNQIVRDLATDFRNLTVAGADPTRVIQGMSGALNQLVIDAVQTGTQIPVAMRPILESLIRQKLLTEEAARALLGMAADTMPSLADIKDAADRYGLSLDQLGPKVAQLRISETAKQIVKDFDLLILAGANVEVVLGGMKDKVQGIVTEALTLGLALPESMRPLIQAMIDLGLLVDANGVKLTSIGQIKFEESLVGAIDRLIEALGLLIDEMNIAGSAADVMWSRFRGDNPPTGIAVPRPGGPGAPTAPTTPTQPPGSRPAPINFGEPGGPPDRGPSVDVRFAPAPGSTTVILELDGRTIAEATVPHIPGEARRFVAS